MRGCESQRSNMPFGWRHAWFGFRTAVTPAVCTVFSLAVRHCYQIILSQKMSPFYIFNNSSHIQHPNKIWQWNFSSNIQYYISSVLRHCWLDDKNGIRPVKSRMLACRWWRFDWSFVRLSFVVNTTSFLAPTRFILVLANSDHLEKMAVKIERKNREYSIVILTII